MTAAHGHRALAVFRALAPDCHGLQKSCEVVLANHPSPITAREAEAAGGKWPGSRSHSGQVAEREFDQVCWTENPKFFPFHQEVNSGNAIRILACVLASRLQRPGSFCMNEESEEGLLSQGLWSQFDEGKWEWVGFQSGTLCLRGTLEALDITPRPVHRPLSRLPWCPLCSPLCSPSTA